LRPIKKLPSKGSTVHCRTTSRQPRGPLFLARRPPPGQCSHRRRAWVESVGRRATWFASKSPNRGQDLLGSPRVGGVCRGCRLHEANPRSRSKTSAIPMRSRSQLPGLPKRRVGVTTETLKTHLPSLSATWYFCRGEGWPIVRLLRPARRGRYHF